MQPTEQLGPTCRTFDVAHADFDGNLDRQIQTLAIDPTTASDDQVGKENVAALGTR